MKRWFLLIEGTLCGVYTDKEEAQSDYTKAKRDYPHTDDLIELAETIETTANDETKSAKNTSSYKHWLSKLKVLLNDESSGIVLGKKKREEQ